MAKPDKVGGGETTRSAKAVEAVVKPLIDAAAQTQKDIDAIETMFSETHEICRTVGIPDEKVLQKILRAMIQDHPSFKKTTILEKRDLAPNAQNFLSEGNVFGGKITTIGGTPAEGSWNVWFEKKKGYDWTLAYSKTPNQGNYRSLGET